MTPPRRKTPKSKPAAFPAPASNLPLPALPRMFSSWSRTQRSTPRLTAGDSPTSGMANLATRRCTRLASPATSLPKIATTSSPVTRPPPELTRLFLAGSIFCIPQKDGALRHDPTHFGTAHQTTAREVRLPLASRPSAMDNGIGCAGCALRREYAGRARVRRDGVLVCTDQSRDDRHAHCGRAGSHPFPRWRLGGDGRILESVVAWRFFTLRHTRCVAHVPDGDVRVSGSGVDRCDRW